MLVSSAWREIMKLCSSVETIPKAHRGVWTNGVRMCGTLTPDTNSKIHCYTRGTSRDLSCTAFQDSPVYSWAYTRGALMVATRSLRKKALERRINLFTSPIKNTRIHEHEAVKRTHSKENNGEISDHHVAWPDMHRLMWSGNSFCRDFAVGL